MGKSFGLNRLIPLAIIVAGIAFHSCKDDVFNPEKVKQTYQDKFPVKDIDPNMDWKMTKQVAINIAVYEDEGTDYIIRIYDANPLIDESDAKLLTEGTANNTMAFTTTMDCPNILTEVFVCRIDNHNRSIVKYVSIENNQVNVTFGTPPIQTRATFPNGGVEIETYSPEKSETEIRNLLSGATEVSTGTIFKNGEVYKISKGKTFDQISFTQGGLTSENPAIIIIEGTWAPQRTVNIQRGFELYILDGGKIKIPDNQTLEFVNNSNFIIYPGGSITGQKLSFSNASEGKYNYNAGTIDIKDFHVSQSGAFYNCGVAKIGNADFTSGCRLINQGKAYISSANSNLIIENGCNLEAECLVCKLTMGNNSSAQIAKFGNAYNNYNTKVSLGRNSLMTITEIAELDQAEFTGPTTGYALVKANNIRDITNGDFKSKGNIYYEVKSNKDDIKDNSWYKRLFQAIKNSNATISRWDESPLLLPPGDCTGKGNTPTEGLGTSKNPYRYTYVFEDNFPLVGDYDFNDVVLDVETYYKRDEYNRIKEMKINITLAAAGASKTVGAGLRIVDVPKSAIDEIDTDGDDDRFENTLKGENSLFHFNDDTKMEEGDNNIVIPIFGNAHKVFKDADQGQLINTDPKQGKKKAFTYEVTIEFEDKQTVPLITKDNLDFFICYQYKTMQKRMEVHLYEFWDYGATAAGTVQKTNLDLAGNNTWAICVPNFRYPKELINISNQEDENNCAYPYFLDWARNRNVHQDWYLYPNEDNVYR